MLQHLMFKCLHIRFSALALSVLLGAMSPTLCSAEPSNPSVQNGRASFYANWFNGRRTASGDVFNNAKMTAAHPSLPFGTRVQVTNLSNGRKAVVTINDRGPYVGHRIIDLTHEAAKHLDMVDQGVQHVQVKVLD